MSKISAFQSYLNAFTLKPLLDILQSVIPALVCITLHELSHGLMAYRLGDPTAKLAGRLTLNPLKHLDIFGLLMMVVAHVGWAKPVPINMYRFQNPKRGMAITAAAGPASNVLIAMVFFFLYGFAYVPAVLYGGETAMYFTEMLALTGSISVGYAVFNLIPIPPLDGSKVLFGLLSEECYEALMRYERYGFLLLYALVFSRALNGPLMNAISWCTDRLWIFAQWGNQLSYSIFVR